MESGVDVRRPGRAADADVSPADRPHQRIEPLVPDL
jgi:hypothetical protein